MTQAADSRRAKSVCPCGWVGGEEVQRGAVGQEGGHLCLPQWGRACLKHNLNLEVLSSPPCALVFLKGLTLSLALSQGAGVWVGVGAPAGVVPTRSWILAQAALWPSSLVWGLAIFRCLSPLPSCLCQRREEMTHLKPRQVAATPKEGPPAGRRSCSPGVALFTGLKAKLA